MIAPYATPTNTGVDRSDNTARPVSMRIVRKGDTFQGFYSEDDGKTWIDLGDPTSADLGATSKDTITGFSKTPWVGIALSGHSEGDFSEADIDQEIADLLGALEPLADAGNPRVRAHARVRRGAGGDAADRPPRAAILSTRKQPRRSEPSWPEFCFE